MINVELFFLSLWLNNHGAFKFSGLNTRHQIYYLYLKPNLRFLQTAKAIFTFSCVIFVKKVCSFGEHD